MRITLHLLSIVPTTAALALSPPSVFDYSKLPACARKCKILDTSEQICVPPSAPFSNQATYVDCVCQSEYLRSLHANGEICHDVCNDKDDLVIYHSYNSLCGTPHYTPSSTPIPTTTINPSAIADPSKTATPAPTDDYHDGPQGNDKWIHHNRKYILIPCILLLGVLLVLLVFAYRHRRSRHKQELENANRNNGLIPLRLRPSQSLQPLRPSDQSDWPLRAPSTAALSVSSLRSPSIAPPMPSPKFGNARRVLRNEDRIVRRSSLITPRTPIGELQDTERLIEGRTRNSGLPRSPLSATPKI